METLEQKEYLITQAFKALDFAYSPYSGNKVGASIASHTGKIYQGANIGNACSPLNICAEQVAIGNALMNSDLDFMAIAIVQNSGEICFPCGRCLQLLSEFADDMLILSYDGANIKEYRLKTLLPVPYRRKERVEL